MGNTLASEDRAALHADPGTFTPEEIDHRLDTTTLEESLLAAVSSQSLAAVKLVLRLTGTSCLYVTDYSNMSCLAHAVCSNRPNIVEVLLQADDTRESLHIPSEMGYTPMMMAAEWGYIEIMDLLYRADPTIVDAGALPRAAQAGNADAIEWILQKGSHRINTPIDGSTPLHMAATSRSAKAISVLLRYGADVYAMDNDGNTPLHLGANGTCDVNYMHPNAHSGIGSTPYTDVVETLLRAGRNAITMQNAYGDTPLHIAAYAGSAAMVLVLLRWDDTVSTCNLRGDTPIMIVNSNLQVALFEDDGDDFGREIAKLSVAQRNGEIACHSLLSAVSSEPNLEEDEVVKWRYHVYFSRSLLSLLL